MYLFIVDAGAVYAYTITKTGNVILLYLDTKVFLVTY